MKLPDRQEAQGAMVCDYHGNQAGYEIVKARADGRLKSRDEMDEEAAMKMYAMMDCGVMTEEEVTDWSADIWDDCRWGAKQILDAAFGSTDPHGIAEDWNSPEDNEAWGVTDE